MQSIDRVFKDFLYFNLCAFILDIFPSCWSQGYRQKDSYMASQGPLQHTIEDFWRMIWEWRSCSIVMLTELEERGQVCVCVETQTLAFDNK